jgi:hypothetical protein
LENLFCFAGEVLDEESLFSVTTQVPVSYEPVFNVNKSVQRNGTGTICKNNPHKNGHKQRPSARTYMYKVEYILRNKLSIYDMHWHTK